MLAPVSRENASSSERGDYRKKAGNNAGARNNGDIIHLINCNLTAFLDGNHGINRISE
jgi:hypothetical protein